MKLRGQATVELALGALVFVTILLLGIHFAEVGMLSVKVQEASAWAAWEASARRVQNLATHDTFPFDAILSGPTAVGPQAMHNYEDFNGLTSVDTGNSVVMRALTKGSGMTVRCQENAALRWQPSGTASRAYVDRGGFECTSEADIAAQLPIKFLNDANGFFRAKNYDARHTSLKICGMGRASGPSCSGYLPILLGDWGLAGDAEKGECKLAVDGPTSCISSTGNPNQTYKTATQNMWSPGFGKAKALAQQWAGSVPSDPNEFWFSYSGLEDDYNTTVGGEGLQIFKTGGPGLGSIPDERTAADCFLGKPGC
jgi:hypothetical protein